jgi:hypothetical protein
VGVEERGYGTDDQRAPIGGSERFGLPYLRIGVVVAIAAGILSVGLFGPHPAPAGTPTPQPTASRIALVPTPKQSPTPGPDAIALAPLASYQPAGADVRSSWLPSHVSSGTIAAVGTRLFFVVSSNVLESTVIGSDAAPQPLATFSPCQSITQVAAAGDALAYVVTRPTSLAPGSTECQETPDVGWTVWLSDLRGGHRREVASGVRPVDTADTRAFPVHIALTPSTIAIARHTSPGTTATGEIVEVRSVADDRLLWMVGTSGRVLEVMLGGSTVAVVQDDQGLELDIGDQLNPALFMVARPASGAALSEDGRYLSWDTAADPGRGLPGDIETMFLPLGVRDRVAAPAGPSGAAVQPLRPAVSSGPAGPVVAWFATVDGLVLPAFREGAGGAGTLVAGVPAPDWLALRGSTLILVSSGTPEGATAAFAIDLSKSGFAAG